ncbi:hypothetical protein [Deinococcus cellulosilyticus]|uniref:Uncharacterized protein n=1 Tax=Deinococcus cellulosilyticus (strain DSM 18568 / NBRC 106333 / KACC 11606 / 5516J-15) TaxID=1223518 RepID=A0A511MW95_DEIC1|nr:hypothetical protein [Deinococcus cellulosilyticus]GEM44830.1 hypothetical protein DC3_04650 [Deinococcus cellulosilyticus NBRC 106333 = KACC 11606]
MGIKLNGKYYDWGDISIHLLHGIMLDGSEINYGDEMPVSRSQGAGRGTRGYGQGQYTSAGDVSMRRVEYNRLLEKAREAGGFYLIKPFPITISYRDEEGNIKTDELTFCKFKKRDFKAAEKDENIDVKVEFEILGQIINDGVPAF